MNESSSEGNKRRIRKTSPASLPQDPDPMRMMTHYFSVQETPHPWIQSKVISRHPSIPETPEIENKSAEPIARQKQTKLPSSQSQKRNPEDDKFNDDLIIEEMCGNKNIVKQNE